MTRIYQFDGEVICHDPGPEMIPFFKKIDPGYRIKSEPSQQGFRPRFQKLGESKISTDKALFDLDLQEIRKLLQMPNNTQPPKSSKYTYSKLDLLNVLALKSLSDCKLCGWQCGIDRYRQAGQCGLKAKLYYRQPFIHIAEEPNINPAIVVNFGGCALSCCYCIDHDLWDTNNLDLVDSESFWKRFRELIQWENPINTIEFTNPTESLPAILHLLQHAPDDFNLPVVFNCHLYGAKPFYEIATEIVDVWLPDLRYGSNECAKELSGVNDYLKYAEFGLKVVVGSGSEVIVRLLVLPGHFECCHKPAIELLEHYKDRIWVSVLDQYVPDYMAIERVELRKPISSEEIRQVTVLVEENGLSKITDIPTHWY